MRSMGMSLVFASILVINGVDAAAMESDSETSLGSFTHVTVGVADLNAVLTLWKDTFGFDVRMVNEGPDPGLSKLLGLPADGVAAQALVGTPGIGVGAIHFVQFTNPIAPVREGANTFDLVPKNLDVYTHDLPARYQELVDAGQRFRSPWRQVDAPNGVTFREAHLHGHDEVNIVMVEVLGADRKVSPQGYSGVGALITTVADGHTEMRFYADVLGLDVLTHNLLTGPEIEKVVGLPPGTGLDIYILGAHGSPFGEIELVDYQGVEGNNLYAKAQAPALGTLHVSYSTNSLQAWRERFTRLGVDYVSNGLIQAQLASTRSITLRSPAGMRIDIHEPAD